MDGSSSPEEASIAESQATPEQREKLENTAFVLSIDKEGLASERDNINPAGLNTLDIISRLPDKLAFPKGSILIVGPNGSGKSTLLGLIGIMGNASSYQVTSNEAGQQLSWEAARDQVLQFNGTPEVQKRKLGIAPTIAKHVVVEDGSANLDLTKMYRIPEIAGAAWQTEEIKSQGLWEPVTAAGQKEIKADFVKRGPSEEVKGSTQQIIDQTLQKEISMDMRLGEVKTILLDEPTSNADIKRTLNFLPDLDKMNAETGNNTTFVVATNEGLLSLNRNVPRIDFNHPERRIHRLSDYSLDPEIQAGLQAMGYTPIQETTPKL